MNIGDKVITPVGTGVIIKPEGAAGILSKRFLVKVSPLIDSTYYRQMQAEQGGLYFLSENLKKIESKNKQYGLQF